MKLAMQLNAIVGLVSTLMAGAIMSLVLTRPEAIASAVAQREYGAVAMAVVMQIAGWLHAILQFL